MGEVGHVKAGVKPRPLGFVKREMVHFEDVEGSSSSGPAQFSSSVAGDAAAAAPVHASFFFPRSKTEGDFKTELKSMRDLQETLRQAALLNIVAAVNNDGKVSSGHNMPTSSRGPQPAGIKGAHIFGQSFPENSKLVLSHGSNPEHTGGVFSRHLHAAVPRTPGTPNAPPTTARTPMAPPSTALNQLLQRSRTISIPRPRTHTENNFIHSSIKDAREHLTGMTHFRARTKADVDNLNNNHVQNDSETNGYNPHDNGDSHFEKNDNTEPPPTTRAGPRAEVSTASFGLQVEGGAAGKKPSTDVSSIQADSVTSRLSKEEQRAHNVHQMQMLKRHISTSKKRELVKKLTEIAKCEAVDMREAVVEARKPGTGMIIMAKNGSDHSLIEDDEEPQFETIRSTIKSASSLVEKQEERVPSTVRVKSETLEGMLNYREAKHNASQNHEGDLRIDGVNPNESGELENMRLNGYAPDNNLVSSDMYTNAEFNTWLKEQRLTGYTTRAHPFFATPDVLELRPLAGSPLYAQKQQPGDKRKIVISRRGVNPLVRDKLVSPSPLVYETCFHKPKASMRRVTMVGKSLPSLPVSKLAMSETESPRDDTGIKSFKDEASRTKRGGSQEETMRLLDDGIATNDPTKPNQKCLRPWGSTVRQSMTDSPILRTEILDHLQCVAIVDRRPNPTMAAAAAGARVKSQLADRLADDENSDLLSDDEEYDKIKSSQQRKSKLYSAFSASQENLANFASAEVSSLASEALTTRSMLNVSASNKHMPTLSPPPPSPMVTSQPTEPRYMGSSSRVSDNETRSQFHVINEQREATKKEAEVKAGHFRVFKALDQDVYSDFQHKKWRGGSVGQGAANTAPDKPRMHFIKIKYTGETKS